MVSIRLKLFTGVKGGKNKHGRPNGSGGKGKKYNDFKDLLEVRDSFPPGPGQPGQQPQKPKQPSQPSSSSSSSAKPHTGGGSTPNPTATPPTDDKQKVGAMKRFIERYKTDPEFKKKVKTGGFITLGTAVATGAAIGGVKLYKKRKQQREEEAKNEEVKNQMLKK